MWLRLMMVLAAVLLTMALVQFRSEVRRSAGAQAAGSQVSRVPERFVTRRHAGRSCRARPTGPETWRGLFSTHAIGLVHVCRALVVRDGDRVIASGRLVRNPDGDWFEPALPRTLIAGVDRQVAPPWRGAVRIAGANFDALSNRFERDAAVEGYASVTGIWSYDRRPDSGQQPRSGGVTTKAPALPRAPER